MQLPTSRRSATVQEAQITAAGAAAATAVVLAVTVSSDRWSSAVAVATRPVSRFSSGDQVKSLSAESGMASQRAISDQAGRPEEGR